MIINFYRFAFVISLVEQFTWYMRNPDDDFKDLYCNNFNRIKNFANTYLRDEEASISVAQDVFMSLLENKNSFTFDDTLLPYIFVLSKNRCLNILKKKKAKIRYQRDKLYQMRIDIALEALSEQQFNNLDYLKLKTLYEEALASLPENTKETFLLSRNDNLKYKDIAKIQNISIKTVEYRIMFALRILRNRLKDYQILLFLFYIYGIINQCCIK